VGVLMSQRDLARTNDIDAHGQVVWFWHPGADAKFAALDGRVDDGGKKAGPRGEREAAVKTIAQGRPVLG
jgi:hypothetical protein